MWREYEMKRERDSLEEENQTSRGMENAGIYIPGVQIVNGADRKGGGKQVEYKSWSCRTK